MYNDVLPLIATSSITGVWFNKGIGPCVHTATCAITGTWNVGGVWSGDPLVATASFKEPDAITEYTKDNWVKWSNIGSLDFTIWRDNVAGERPLPQKGWIYQLIKKGNRVVAYSQNGVGLLIPAGTAYGYQKIYELGIKSKHAAVGTDDTHYFVDVENRLFKLTDNLERLDYSEYLSNLGETIVMSLDKETGNVYICDGAYGYVYSPRDNSLGECSPYITGVGSQNGTRYVAASSAITTPVFEICTDIIDFGSRVGKTIYTVDVGTDLTNALYVAVDYRRDKSSAWSTTAWRLVDASGSAYVPCYGTEFRIKVKTLTYEYFELDYLKINGVVHGH